MGSRVDEKVVVLGKHYVGKTALVTRLLKNKFNELSPYQPTIGAAYSAKKISVDNLCIVLGIWDTAGSERFEAMSALYYRGSKAAIVCYDLADETSFQKAKFYINELKQNEEDCLVYLCGTKHDLISSGEKVREVDSRSVSDYARAIKARTVMETSSKTGLNVEELFCKIAEDLSEQRVAESVHPTPYAKLGFHEPFQERKITCPCWS